MQTVHRLESHKSQVDRPALSHGIFRDFQDLSHRWLSSIFDVTEVYCMTVDQQFDRFGPLLRIGCVQDDAFNLDGLIELVA
jgi:hypothetical protein